MHDCDCDELEPAAQDDGHDQDLRTDLAIQAWKDDRAMDYIDRDGNPIEPEPDYDRDYEGQA